MIINLPLSFKEDVESFGVEIPDADKILDQETFQLDLNLCEESHIDKIYDMLKPHSDARAIRVSINAFRRSREDQGGMQPTLFEQLASDLSTYLTSNASRGWLYKLSDMPEPEVVTGISFSPYVKESRNRPEQDERITISTSVNSLGKTSHRSHTVKGGGGKAKMDPIALLNGLGLQKETEELHQLYDEQLERFRVIRPLYGHQLR